MYNKHLPIDDYGTRSAHRLTLAAVVSPSCTTTTTPTDTMPNRFYVPTLIVGMILTVRITLSFQTKPVPIICASGCLQLPLVEVPGKVLYSHLSTFSSFNVQDMQCVENCDDPDPKRHVLYEQPVWQTLQMFRMSPHAISPLPIPLSGLHTHYLTFPPQLEKCSVRPLALFSLPHVLDSDECFTGAHAG